MRYAEQKEQNIIRRKALKERRAGLEEREEREKKRRRKTPKCHLYQSIQKYLLSTYYMQGIVNRFWEYIDDQDRCISSVELHPWEGERH